jgi:RNA polymerase sigma-70 factor, ECF subfamily
MMQVESAEIVSRIWDESRNRLKGFIAKRINNEADAEDILQNVFFKIHQNVAGLKDPDKLYSWVFQMTRNAITDFYREQKIAVDFSEEALHEIAVEQPDRDVEEEVLRWLEQMVEELPGKYREALLLTDIKGLTQKELSEKLDISLSGAKSRVQRAREKLRETVLDCCRLEFNRAGRIVEYKPRNENCRVCSH